MKSRIAQAVEALEGHDESVRALFDVLPQLIWTALPDGRLDYINEPFYSFTNWKPDKALGNDWISIIHEEDVKHSVERWGHSLQTAEPYEVEHRIKRAADGAYIWHLVRAVPIKDADGKVIKWIGTSVDIHHQKKVEEQLSHFVYMASHDLSGPLNNIKSLIELFRNLPQQEWKQLHDYLEVSTNRLEDNLKKIVSQVTVPVKKEVVSELKLSAQLDRVLDMGLQDELDQQGGLIEADFSARPQLNYVASDLQIIFQTLIVNALRFAHPDRPLILKISSKEVENEYVLLRFEDNASGIDLQQFREKLFAPFACFHAGKSGTGIGLYLLKSMLNRHGGKIELESSCEKGSSFLVYLKDQPILST